MNGLRLSTLRLVGFHNYDDELINIVGDLFVVGINESGKTTILDALHLVLSGGQHWDLNAAAKMAGSRDEGRSLNGIILRAGLSGAPGRTGGSITYAVAEFLDSKDQPVTFVFGASATDMKARTSKWGLITRTRAADLPLVTVDEQGSRRIANRDALGERYADDLYKDMAKYRVAVADRLFGDREGFDRITELWRQAKSYRELAKVARDIGDLFRKVLPEPDAEPFDKVAKGFKDVAQIEQTLSDLRDDVTALVSLEEICCEARDSRETRRRYEYIRSKATVDRLTSDLHEKRKQIRQIESDKTDLQSSIEILAQQEQSLTEQLKRLHASDAYASIAMRDSLATEIDGVEKRIDTKSGQIEAENAALEIAQKKLQSLRADIESLLVESRDVLDEAVSELRDKAVVLVDSASTIQSLIPKTPDGSLRAEEIGKAVATWQDQVQMEKETLAKQVREKELQQQELESRVEESRRELKRIKSTPDLVPRLPELDDVLASFAKHGIKSRFLFQEIEFAEHTTAEEKALIESAIGVERLSTLIVSPTDTDGAREIIFGTGCGVRILDAVAVQRDSNAKPTPACVTSFLKIDNDRARPHLEALLSDVDITVEPEHEGANRRWLQREGIEGERGARRKFSLADPEWIGEKRRGELRAERVSELETAIREDELAIAQVAQVVAGYESAVTAIVSANDRIDSLKLPYTLESQWSQLKQCHSDVEGPTSRLRDMRIELNGFELERKSKEESLAHIEKQLSGVDVEQLTQEVQALEGHARKATENLGGERQKLKEKSKSSQLAQEAIPHLELKLSESEAEFSRTRDAVMEVLPPEIDDLDHYVFATKRGASIKDIDESLESIRMTETQAVTKLKGSDGVLNNRFAQKFRFQVQDENGRIGVIDYRGESLDQILRERQEQEQQWNESLDKKNRDLIQTVLAHDLTNRLNNDVLTLEQTIRGLNSVLRDLQFGHTRFQLHYSPASDHKSFVKLIQRQSLLNEAEQLELRHHLETRQDALTGEGEIPPFLDYRNWFQFSFKVIHVEADDELSIGRSELVKGSGGAQATHNYLLLFALAGFLFDRTNARVRILMMDEAFFGLDSERKELLLRCAKKLNLDLVIASPDLDGTVLGEGYDTTSLLVEKDDKDNILLAPLVWEKSSVQGDLFAEPRPAAIIGADDREDT